MSSAPTTPPDLPEPLRELLGDLPRRRFSAAAPHSQAQSESADLFEVKTLQDLLARTAVPLMKGLPRK